MMTVQPLTEQSEATDTIPDAEALERELADLRTAYAILRAKYDRLERWHRQFVEMTVGRD